MPLYVYGCNHKDHPRVEVEHSVNYPYLERCAVCGGILHRVPQRFQWGVSPQSLIQEWGERNFSKKLKGEPTEQAYDSVRTDRGKPQKDFYARK
jgi:hypothetical protein